MRYLGLVTFMLILSLAGQVWAQPSGSRCWFEADANGRVVCR